MKDITIWGIHAGAAGEADELFQKKALVALGWPEQSDLSKLPPDREAYKERMRASRPHLKERAIPLQAGQYFRFVHEMQVGDLVIYPSKVDRLIHIGKVRGPYNYDPKKSNTFPHQRSVEWLGAYPRTLFSQGALWEVGSAMSFFQVKNFAPEFLTVLESKGEMPQAMDEDESIALVAEDIEQTTRDFILKQLNRHLKEHALEHFVAHLLECMGYRAKVTPPSHDGGVDIIAHKDELGLEPPIIKVQVKSGEATIGRPVLSSLAGALLNNDCGLFVTLGTFSKDAESFAKSKGNLRLIDKYELVDLIYAHYEKFDAKYKGLIPLKRVYVPEALEESE